ncbi:MAG: hypothetical protein Q9179_000994 [Wetmoreana sp. 5 TL-2023]
MHQASSALATGAIIRACLERPNFYSSSVYIAQSNACLFILTNLALLSIYSVILGLQKAFYGPLRPVEVEQLWEKAWFALTETALAMTIFRDEVGGWFLFMFTFLLISKVWNWLAEGRVELLEQQPPPNPRLFHTRLSTALSLSVFFNMYMLRFCTGTVLQQARLNMMVMFAFEFAVLAILSISTSARYALSLYEAAVVKRQIVQGRERLRRRTANPLSEEEAASAEIDAAGWEEKGLWLFYLDIATGEHSFTHCYLVLYLTFFCVLCIRYGMPIHIIRDVALTVRSFYKRVRDFVQYKQATRDMNARYPDATAEEIQREDVCIICRENMTVWQHPTTPRDTETPQVEHQPIDERQRAKKLPCGHLLHFACLRSWLERQQICPTCRTPVLSNNAEASSTNQMAGANVQGARGAANPAAGGPHVYTLGPFRVVFGARQVNNEPLPNPNAPFLGNPSQTVLQHRNLATFTSTGVQAQLNQIEQHISREISNLGYASSQLQVIRALQAELSRLRVSQGIPGPLPGPNHQIRQVSQPMPQHTLQAYRPEPLGQGQQDLPAGLTLPHGWTLHALQRIPASAIPGVIQGNNAEALNQPQQPTTGEQQVETSQAPAPDYTTTSTSSAEPLESDSDPSAFEVQGPEFPRSEQNRPSVRADMSESALDGTSSMLPEWGSAAGNGRASQVSAEEDSKAAASQQKGKSRAVTVEDDEN